MQRSRLLHNSFGFHVLDQRSVVAIREPVATGQHDFELVLEKFGGHPTARMISDKACRVRQVAHHASNLGMITDARFPAAPLAVQVEPGG